MNDKENTTSKALEGTPPTSKIMTIQSKSVLKIMTYYHYYFICRASNEMRLVSSTCVKGLIYPMFHKTVP